MVCDYRVLNKITIFDFNSLPLLNKYLEHVSGAGIFSQMYLIGAFHKLGIAEKQIHKIAIRTSPGSFELTVICFGFTNGPTLFSRLRK